MKIVIRVFIILCVLAAVDRLFGFLAPGPKTRTAFIRAVIDPNQNGVPYFIAPGVQVFSITSADKKTVTYHVKFLNHSAAEVSGATDSAIAALKKALSGP